MSLADMLVANRKAAADAAEAKVAMEAAIRAAALKKVEDDRTALLDLTYGRIVRAITAGKEPKVKIKSYENQQWVSDCANPKKDALNFDVWLAFKDRLAAEGLRPVVVNEHDGMGMESWVVIKVQPI